MQMHWRGFEWRVSTCKFPILEATRRCVGTQREAAKVVVVWDEANQKKPYQNSKDRPQALSILLRWRESLDEAKIRWVCFSQNWIPCSSCLYLLLTTYYATRERLHQHPWHHHCTIESSFSTSTTHHPPSAAINTLFFYQFEENKKQKQKQNKLPRSWIFTRHQSSPYCNLNSVSASVDHPIAVLKKLSHRPTGYLCAVHLKQLRRLLTPED